MSVSTRGSKICVKFDTEITGIRKMERIERETKQIKIGSRK